MRVKAVTGVMIALLAPALAAPAHAVERAKVDIVVVKNGDRVTGEILQLAHGRLSVDTDSMGTVQIEWPDVVSLQSTQAFIFEDVDGSLLYGSIGRDPEPRHFTIDVEGEGPRRVETTRVARISQGAEKFLDRVNGSLSVGFDYTKSSDITVLSGSFNLNYRGPQSSWNFGVDLNSTRDPAQGTFDRDSIKYGYRWLQPGRRFWAGVTSLERNEETGIEARALVGGGYGKYFVETIDTEFSGFAGIAATREWATGAAGAQTSLEGMLGADWRIFDFASPKTNLTARGIVFPSLTESGRYRTDTSVSLRREIVTDFYLDLTLYQSYDSDPPDVNAAKSDFGVTTSLGYSF